MKVRIDREECIGCASCWSVCPDFFEEGSDDTSQIVEVYRAGDDISAGEVPENLTECVQDAAGACPVEAIKVEE